MIHRISAVAAVVAVLTLAGAAWSWSGVVRARTEAKALGTRLGALRAHVAELAALPELPPLPPIAETLSEFLAGLPDGVTVKSAGPQDPKAAVFRAVPNIPGIRLAVLEVTDAHPQMGLPTISVVAAARWQQRRWPLQVSRAVWTTRGVVTTVTLYGR